MRSSIAGPLVTISVTLLVGCPAGPPASDASKSQPVVASEPAKAEPAKLEPGTGLPPLPDDVVASVGGEPIARAEFDVRYEPVAATILARRDDGKVPEPFQAMQRETILAKLIWSKQLELEAERSGVDVTPEQLAKHEADERRHILDWTAWLARVGQSEPVRHQANIDYLRERALLESRVGSLAPSEAELLAAYEAKRAQLKASEPVVRAAHIQLAYGPRVGDEKIQPPTAAQLSAATPEQKAAWEEAARLRAVALRELASAPGVDFHEFAREWSEGPGAYRGEDMGLFPKRQMVPEYSDVAFALQPGQISEPVKSSKGYYVIKSFGLYEVGPLPFEAVRKDLERELEAEKYEQARDALRKELDERFTVESQALADAKAFRAARAASKGMAAPSPAK